MPDFGEIIKAVEILATGTHTANNGKKVEVTPDYLRKMAGGYDIAYSEAPVVIGHPELNGPAYGWVKTLYLNPTSSRLLADIDVAPEFAELVRKGFFKKRSSSIYPDLNGKGPYLRHLGFLGAAPPAIKGLADLNLADGKDCYVFEFSQKEAKAMSWKDLFKTRMSEAVDAIPEGAGTLPGAAPQIVLPATVPVVQFSEEDVKKREEAAAKKAKEEAALEFSEKLKTQEAQRLEAEHKAEVKRKIDSLVSEGKVIPAWVKGGLVEFAQSLPHLDQASGGSVIQFSEGKKGSPYEWLMSFLEELPKAIDFGEFARRDNETDASGSAGAKLEALTQKKMAENKELTYSLAFSEVSKEHPELAEAYALEFTQG